MCPALFFMISIVLVIWSLLLLHVYFRLIFKKLGWTYLIFWLGLNWIALDSIKSLIVLILLIYVHGRFSGVCVFFCFFPWCSIIFTIEIFYILDKLCQSVKDFYNFFLSHGIGCIYCCNCQTLFIPIISYCSLDSPIYRIISTANEGNLTSFIICVPLISFSCIVALA